MAGSPRPSKGLEETLERTSCCVCLAKADQPVARTPFAIQSACDKLYWLCAWDGKRRRFIPSNYACHRECANPDLRRLQQHHQYQHQKKHVPSHEEEKREHREEELPEEVRVPPFHTDAKPRSSLQSDRVAGFKAVSASKSSVRANHLFESPYGVYEEAMTSYTPNLAGYIHKARVVTARSSPRPAVSASPGIGW